MNHLSTFLKCDVYGVEKRREEGTLEHPVSRYRGCCSRFTTGLYNKVSPAFFKKGSYMMPFALLPVQFIEQVQYSSFSLGKVGIVTNDAPISTSCKPIVTPVEPKGTLGKSVVTPSVAVVTPSKRIVTSSERKVTPSEKEVIPSERKVTPSVKEVIPSEVAITSGLPLAPIHEIKRHHYQNNIIV